jgi:DNA polymerase-3 subunit epsilon
MTANFNLTPIDALGDDCRVLNRIPGTKLIADLGIGVHSLDLTLNTPVGDERKYVMLDTETTGFSPDTDAIIEIGMLKVSYSPSAKRITSVDEVLCFLEESPTPLKPIITEVTGLTDALIKGHQIDDNAVSAFVADADFIVAHNASFDRRFFDKRFPLLNDLIWDCSAKGGDIKWRDFGFSSSALEFINQKLNFFYDAHRASVDCMATVWPLFVVDGAFAQLLESIQSPRYIVDALNSPFEVKEQLKALGMSWNPDRKCWQATVSGDAELQSTLNSLSSIYDTIGKRPYVTEVPPNNRYRGC